MDEELKKKVKEVRAKTGAPMYMCIDYVKKYGEVDEAIRYLSYDYIPKRKDGDRFYRTFLLDDLLIVIGTMSEMGMRSSSLPEIIHNVDPDKLESGMMFEPKGDYLDQVNQSMTLRLNEDCKVCFYLKDTSNFSTYLHKKLDDSAVGGFLLVKGKHDSELLSEIHSALPKVKVIKEADLLEEGLIDRLSFNGETLKEIFLRSKVQKVWFLK